MFVSSSPRSAQAEKRKDGHDDDHEADEVDQSVHAMSPWQEPGVAPGRLRG
jgi:hypothetical protein